MGERTVAAGWTFLVTDAAGRCAGDDHGLYHRDTRLLDRHEVALGERPTEPVGRLSPRPGERVLVDDAPGDPPATLRRTRLVVGEAGAALPGVYERIEVRNGGSSTLSAALRLAVGTRFDDVLEVHGDADERTRSVAVAPGDGVAFSYTPDDAGRGGQLAGVALDADAQVDVHGGFGRADAVLGTDLRVAPGASATVHAAAVAGDPVGDARVAFADARTAVRARAREWWDGLAPVGAAAADDRAAVVHRSVEDLLALALDTGHGPVLAAGVPRYGAPLGADAALSAHMALPLTPRPAAATLGLLAANRATGDEAGVRAGRMPGALRQGERAPGRFESGVAATPLWVVLLHATWRRTGDDDLVAELWPALEGALDWLRGDGGGFLTAPADRRDGVVVRPDGRPVEGPAAPAALQGYAHDALRRAAALAEGHRGDDERARSLRRQAGVLQEAFDAAFWRPEAETYAAAVDADGDPVGSVAAAAGHCLWSGVVPAGRSGAVVECLLGPDCFSGWGPRSLPADHGGYDPDGPHRGGVRPRDAGVAALGAARYGHQGAAERLSAGLFDAAAALDGSLPAWFGGHSRGEREGVAVPAGACRPSAPAAAAPVACLRATEGLGLPLDVG